LPSWLMVSMPKRMEGVLNCMTWYIDPSPFPLIFSRSKNLTAEVAEHAEEWPKDQGKGCKEGRSPIGNASRKANTPKEIFREGSLRSPLPPQSTSRLPPWRKQIKKDSYPPKFENNTKSQSAGRTQRFGNRNKLQFAFLGFWKKKLCGLCVLCG
jgi:hypothetical protein